MSSTGTVLDGVAFTGTITRFLIQIAIVVTLARVLTKVLKPLKQPAVVAEMIAGIILGPTVLGRWPAFVDAVFPAASLPIVNTISQYGLICFMMLVGLEIDVSKVAREGKSAAIISFAGTIIPFAFAAFLAVPFHKPEYSASSFLNLVLFLGIAVGMSALPVLARILDEYKLLRTRVGVLTMAMTAFDDVVAWFLLAIVSAIVRTGGSISMLYVFLLIIAHTIVLLVAVRPLLHWLVRSSSRHGRMTTTHFFAFMCILGCNAYITEMIGITTLVGAFQIGLLLPRGNPLEASIPGALEHLVVVVLMPLFFVQSGLRTNFALINSGEAVGLTILSIVVATISKVVGIMLPSALFCISWRTSLVVGALMSCKGLVALIVVNVGLELGVMTSKLYAILVLMVLATTILTVPLTALTVRLRRWRLPAGVELEEIAIGEKAADAVLQRAASTRARAAVPAEADAKVAERRRALIVSDVSCALGLATADHCFHRIHGKESGELQVLWVQEDQPFTMPTDINPSRLVHAVPPLALAVERATCLADRDDFSVSVDHTASRYDATTLRSLLLQNADASMLIVDPAAFTPVHLTGTPARHRGSSAYSTALVPQGTDAAATPVDATPSIAEDAAGVGQLVQAALPVEVIAPLHVHGLLQLPPLADTTVVVVFNGGLPCRVRRVLVVSARVLLGNSVVAESEASSLPPLQLGIEATLFTVPLELPSSEACEQSGAADNQHQDAIRARVAAAFSLVRGALANVAVDAVLLAVPRVLVPSGDSHVHHAVDLLLDAIITRVAAFGLSVLAIVPAVGHHAAIGEGAVSDGVIAAPRCGRETLPVIDVL